jgi:hypothetical protein
MFGPVSTNVRLTTVRKLAVEAADNGLLAPTLAAGISGPEFQIFDGLSATFGCSHRLDCNGFLDNTRTDGSATHRLVGAIHVR